MMETVFNLPKNEYETAKRVALERLGHVSGSPSVQPRADLPREGVPESIGRVALDERGAMRDVIRRNGMKLVNASGIALLSIAFERLIFWVDVIAIGSAIVGLFGGHGPDIASLKAAYQITEQAVHAASMQGDPDANHTLPPTQTLQVDTSGNLKVNIINGNGNSGTDQPMIMDSAGHLMGTPQVGAAVTTETLMPMGVRVVGR